MDKQQFIKEKILNNVSYKIRLSELVESINYLFDNTDDTDAIDLNECFELSEFLHDLQADYIIHFVFDEVRINDDRKCYQSIRIQPGYCGKLVFNNVIEIADIDSIRHFMNFNEITIENIINAIEYWEFQALEFAKKFNFNF